MYSMIRGTITILILLIVALTAVQAHERKLEDFENREGWSYNVSDGVALSLSNEKGITGNAIRIDYDFTKGTGYGGIQKLFPIDMPENYEFTFWLKAQSPPNNFEIKFIDSTGNNVWWVNNRNYSFPDQWQKITVKKRHIEFAWGPIADKELKRTDRIEFTVASFVGGRGTLWIDDLRFRPLPPEMHSWPLPAISASSSATGHPPEMVTDGSGDTYWLSRRGENQTITIDFMVRREFGGLQIRWLKDHQAENFGIFLSDDGIRWEKKYSAGQNRGDVSFIRMPEAEARYLRLKLETSSGINTFGINEIEIPDIRSTLTPNDFIIYCAKNSPAGNFPASFSERASYWTITGVSSDTKEALINEYGMVEAVKSRFSIEPMIRLGDSLYNWSNTDPVQGMGYPVQGDEFDFLPSVTWNNGGLKFITAVSSAGTANLNSMLCIAYGFENMTSRPIDFEFYQLVRPFQVNPYYQFLNTSGGVGSVSEISQTEEGLIAVDDLSLYLTGRDNSFGAATFDEGSIVDMIRDGKLPGNKSVSDPSGMANGVIKYTLHLDAGERTELFALVPYHGNKTLKDQFGTDEIREMFYDAAGYWHKTTDHIRFNLPPSADRLISTWKSNLAYILINRDNAGIQPGSRSYERSWIRDGALTSSALLKSGIVNEVKEFIEWYTSFQFESGKVPCVVDNRGPDPVPEHDSHGEMIYLIHEYFNFTGDTAFLRSKNENVLRAVEYIESLIAGRSTDYYRNSNDSIRAYYGLVPESISHEGYSAKPMHSYWDNFFTIKGLKDAAEIQKILGENGHYKRIAALRDTFRTKLYNSINLAMETRKIDYIPGSVELGDFDPTSTTIALTPCNELVNLPVPQVYNTFNKYYQFFRDRRDGKISWVNYTPYENRLIGSFILLDQPEKAHELIGFFLDDQRPEGWNQWAEVVWHDYRYPGFIGDMPHTWCGSDFINSIRSMFVYENVYDNTLVLASALYKDWIDSLSGMSVENLPTWFGDISYSVKKESDSYHFIITGDVNLPEGGIEIRNFNGGILPSRVTVNGKELTDFSARSIRIDAVPADVMIHY